MVEIIKWINFKHEDEMNQISYFLFLHLPVRLHWFLAYQEKKETFCFQPGFLLLARFVQQHLKHNQGLGWGFLVLFVHKLMTCLKRKNEWLIFPWLPSSNSNGIKQQHMGLSLDKMEKPWKEKVSDMKQGGVRWSISDKGKPSLSGGAKYPLT